MNPNTETYRYNTMAGEFVIDASGRLTRRREWGDDLDEAVVADARATAGMGGGLLVSANNEAMDVTMAEATVGDATATMENEEHPQVEEYVVGEMLDQLQPREVVDFNDI
jgi:hypothetical protein